MWLSLFLNRRPSWLAAGPGQITFMWQALSGELWQGLKIDPGHQQGKQPLQVLTSPSDVGPSALFSSNLSHSERAKIPELLLVMSELCNTKIKNLYLPYSAHTLQNKDWIRIYLLQWEINMSVALWFAKRFLDLKPHRGLFYYE